MSILLLFLFLSLFLRGPLFYRISNSGVSGTSRQLQYITSNSNGAGSVCPHMALETVDARLHICISCFHFVVAAFFSLPLPWIVPTSVEGPVEMGVPFSPLISYAPVTSFVLNTFGLDGKK